jgi:molybdenum cofactor guanylyltransferase
LLLSVSDYYGKINNVTLINEWDNDPLAAKVSCIVLAGGKSKRMGSNKVVATIGERSLIEHVISNLLSFHSEIIVVAAADSKLPSLKSYPGVRIVEDIIPGKGTLGGIYTGLKLSKTSSNIVVACDMPFINKELFNYMLGFAAEAEVIVPRTEALTLEPLHAVYNRSCLEPIENLFKQNRLAVLELYPMVRVKYIQASDITRFDPEHRSFFNINTESDLQTGRHLADKGESHIND